MMSIRRDEVACAMSKILDRIIEILSIVMSDNFVEISHLEMRKELRINAGPISTLYTLHYIPHIIYSFDIRIYSWRLSILK